MDCALPDAPRRIHLTRLMSIWRSAGWPRRDAVELDLVAAGWATLAEGAGGHESIRLTDAGIRLLADYRRRNQRSLSAHDQLASRVAAHLMAAGRIAWADAELDHRERRDAALTSLRFPHGEFRVGQRDLAKAVFNAARLGRCLLAQAPTGIGKTVATLFPMLKACPVQELDKVFILTAKGSGRSLALNALETLRQSHPGMPLRVIELVARDKSCEHPDKVCHGESCPLAKGFYDRLPAARESAVSAGALTRESLREIALANAVCPYYLGQEVARWCDVIVGDYNHFFDNGALLHTAKPPAPR